MSIESISLIDAVYSARLTIAGLPALANVQEAQTGTAPATDPYAPPSSSLTQLSGYGQLLSATNRASDELQSLLGANSNTASSSATAVATATADSTASAATYAVNISQTAKPNIITSGVFTDPEAQIFSEGTFNISVGSSAPVTINISEASGLLGDVGYEWNSLKGIKDAINASDAGVTAAIENDAYGYTLKLTSNSTGAGNTITLSASSDPFDGGASILSSLAFTQTQASADAAFTIDGVPGTSASNTGIALADGATFSIVGTGATTIEVKATPFVAAESTSVTTAATQLAESYNALMGTAAQLIASGGALNGDTTTASPLATALFNASQATYANGISSLTTLAQLGITGTGVTTSVLSINTTTLNAAFAGDAAGTASLLTSVVNTLHGLISGYLGDTGTILSQAKTTEQNMTFLNGQAAGSYTNLANDVKQYVLEKSLSSANTPTGLPTISVFA
jgi:flagellar hook-associated protein 2